MLTVQAAGEDNAEAVVRFLTQWVVDGDVAAREYLAGHAEPEGASLIAVRGAEVLGYVAIVWESNYEGFRSRGIPLLHQISVAEPYRRQGVATRLMDAAEGLARSQGVGTMGITVGLFDAYGAAQRMYARRGYVPDGRGACLDKRPLREGERVTVDHNLIMWLTKDLGR
jgi:GNAT superfamily N-acetyltransferase